MIVIGIDGGGTKTLAIAADHTGKVLAASEGSGTNPHFVGTEAAFMTLQSVYRDVLQKVAAPEPAHIALCVPGLRKYTQEATEVLGGRSELITFTSDVMSTFYGALGKECGVVALAGTGSFVTGCNAHGVTAGAGGWGPVVGDEGSGHMIAVQALKAVGRHYDGMGPDTQLTGKVLQFYNIATAAELKTAVSLDNVSKLTYLVREAAGEGDATAREIIADAAERLAETAAAVVSRLDMDTPVNTLALTGGLPRIGGWFTKPFADRLALLCPSIRQLEPLFPPAGGALLLALRACGLQWSDELITNMKYTLDTLEIRKLGSEC
jgi:N-acetylglucosamine kinase-like BadF-type ATPase